VRAQQHGVLAAQFANQVADFDDLARVQANGGLVKHQHGRIAHQRLRQAHALPVALGQVADNAVCHGRQAAALHHPVHFGAAFGAGNALDLGHIREEGAHDHLFIERHVFGQIADAPLHFDGVFVDLVPVHPGRAP